MSGVTVAQLMRGAEGKGYRMVTAKLTCRIGTTVSGCHAAEATILGADIDGGVFDILTGSGRGLRLVTWRNSVWCLWLAGRRKGRIGSSAVEQLVADRLGDGILAGGSGRREDEGASTVLKYISSREMDTLLPLWYNSDQLLLPGRERPGRRRG